MDFRLRVFESVARNLSFTRAAKELKISQPAISKHVQELESLYSTPLFIREGNQIKITSAGETLLAHSTRIIDAFDWLDYDMSQFAQQSRVGKLRIAATETLYNYTLPALIAAFLKKNPNVEISIIPNKTANIEHALSKKKIDLGAIEQEVENESLTQSPFATDEIVAICAKNGNISTYNSLSLKELKHIPLIIPQTENEIFLLIEDTLKKRRVKLEDLNIMIRLDNPESIKNFVKKADCVGFVSRQSLSIPSDLDKFKIVPLSDLSFNRVLQFIELQSSKNEVASDFIRFAKRMTMLKSQQ
ncbi:MAG: LysR family transcriptional regulator [Bacteroidales bacterium]